MPRFIFIALLMVLMAPASSIAQNFIGKTYKKVKKELKRYNPGSKDATAQISDSAGVLRLSVRGSGTQPADFIYTFNDKGKCRSEKVIAYCDSCYKKLLEGVLNNKKYGWKKVNMNQYVSAFEYKRMLELPVPEESSRFYLILATNWVKETYEMLVPQK